MGKSIFFIHIPKTAGTSLRIAAGDYFGQTKVGLNYGLRSNETTGWVKNHICERQDYFEITNKFINAKCDFFTGHVNIKPYTGVFKHSDIFTIVRNPVDQVLSHFKHFTLHNGYKGSLEDFIVRPQFSNVQSRMLEGYPIELIAHIGLTERYDESLEVINSIFDLNLLNKKLNVNKQSEVIKLDDSIINLIQEINHKDMLLYTKAKELHSKRYFHYKENIPWVYGVVGAFTQDRIGGWAFSSENQESIELELIKNGMVVAATNAIEFRPHLMEFGVNRNGYVGYSFNIDAKVGDCYEVRVSNTAQSIGTRIYNR